MVDLGVPRNVAPDAAGLYNLYLYNIDDLGEIVEQNKRAREAEIPRAEAIIAEHVEKFEGWRAGLEASSIVDDLRGRFQATARSFAARSVSPKCKDVSPEELERLAAITEELIEPIVREPAERLRSGARLARAPGRDRSYAAAFRPRAGAPDSDARGRKEDRE